MYNITHNKTAVSAEELGMVAADGRTKANHQFKFRAIGAVTGQLLWIVCRPHHSRMEQITGRCS